MKRNYLYICLLAVLTATAFSSCQKVINVDLNSASPQIVIEGNITDLPVPDTIKITQTANFSDRNDFPAVTGATVVVSDNQGNTETLKEATPGIYITSTIHGTPYRTYTLSVTANGKVYNASSTMPPPVNLDSLTAINGFFGKDKFAEIFFRDSAATKNYYRAVEVINGSTSKSIFITDDQFTTNDTIEATLFSRDDTLKRGDSVTVLLQAIDKGVFQYFNSLSQLGDGSTTTPANPTSNINNGALGYFNACSVRKRSIVVGK